MKTWDIINQELLSINNDLLSSQKEPIKAVRSKERIKKIKISKRMKTKQKSIRGNMQSSECREICLAQSS